MQGFWGPCLPLLPWSHLIRIQLHQHWYYYPCFMNEETKVNAAAVTFVVILCLKDRDRLGIWVSLTLVPCCGYRKARVSSLPPRYPSPATNHPAQQNFLCTKAKETPCRSLRQLHITAEPLLHAIQHLTQGPKLLGVKVVTSAHELLNSSPLQAHGMLWPGDSAPPAPPGRSRKKT